MYRAFILAVLSACAFKAKLDSSLPISSSDSTSSAQPTAPTASDSPSPAAPIQAGLSSYATRFIDDTNALRAKCPPGPKPPSSQYGECIGKADQAENLYKSVTEKMHPQVQRGHAFLGELRQSIAKWETDEEAADQQRRQDKQRDYDSDVAEHHARELLGQLEAGRTGKVTSTLISFEHRDAGYVSQRLRLLRNQMPMVEKIAKACSTGAKKPVCDLAINREKYFTQMMAAQFDAILAERLEAWTNTINKMKNDGLVAVVNYNSIGNAKKLADDLGNDLDAIGKALGQTNTKATIDAKLAKLHSDFIAAVKTKQNTNAWAAHAKGAKYQDAAVTRAAKQIDGLALVRVSATHPTWEVVFGAYNRPVKRERDIWALMRKSGESFCRLYALTVVEDHLGGGRYGGARAESFGPAEFYVSTCK